MTVLVWWILLSQSGLCILRLHFQANSRAESGLSQSLAVGLVRLHHPFCISGKFTRLENGFVLSHGGFHLRSMLSKRIKGFLPR